MSEDTGAGISGEQFGHILLRTYDGNVLSLDLYETPDLVCRGLYLPAERRREGTLAVAQAAQVELVADWDAQDEMSRRLGATGREGEGYFELTTEDMELYGEISPPIESGGRLIWAGTLRDVAGDRGEFTFVLEQWGSMAPDVLLVLLFFLVFYGTTLAIVWVSCWQQAVRQCGEGNIKVFNLSRRLGGVGLVAQDGCQVECFERIGPT
jgi:hypothetical protein